MRAASLPSAGPAVSPNGTPGHYRQAQPWSAWLPWRARRFRQVATAVLVVFACGSAAAQGTLWTHGPALAIVNVVTSLTFVLTGLTLYRQPGQRGVAWALILAGVCRSLDFADSWNAGPWPAYDIVFGGMDRVFGAWALLRYPNPRLLRYQRVFLILLAGWMLVGRTLMAVTSTARWNGESPSAWWPSLMVNQRLFGLISVVVTAGEGLLGLAILVFLVMRLVQTRGLDRVVITPIIVAGLAAVVAASATAVVQMMAKPGATPNGAFLTEGVVDLAVPLAFLVAVVQRALLLKNIGGLAAQVSAGADISAVRYALRAALRDPTLDVLDLSAPGLALDGGDGTAGDGTASVGTAGDGTAGDGAAGVGAAADGAADVGTARDGAADVGTARDGAASVGTAGDGDGQAGAALARLDGPARDRLVEFIRTEAGVPIAVVIADPALARYRGLFDAAVQTSGLALKNAQLQAQAAQAELDQVRASRARIIEAGLAERRRLERDLHDGVQQHLLGLAAQLTAAMTSTADPAATTAFGQVRDELKGVLGELRDLAHGIHPAVLSQGGLAVALEDVTERLPLPVRVTAPASRAAPAVEATAYFVACEALTNAVKHAKADSASVVIRMTGSWLEMEIADDGVGGATPDGHGLANIVDRVSALDGNVTIDSPPGRGTRLVVRIPCE
jgi:signal transduction histidine kinase